MYASTIDNSGEILYDVGAKVVEKVELHAVVTKEPGNVYKVWTTRPLPRPDVHAKPFHRGAVGDLGEVHAVRVAIGLPIARAKDENVRARWLRHNGWV